MAIKEMYEEFFVRLSDLMKEYDVEICANSPHDARIDMQMYIQKMSMLYRSGRA